MSHELLQQLDDCQQLLLALVKQTPDDDCYRQYHPDLSPLAWHLGHCVFIETYWLYEQVLGDTTLTETGKDLYFPELSPKQQRAARLPEKHELLTRSKERFARNRELARRLLADNNHRELLKDDYLLHFLLQHHSQHFETMQQILQQRALRAASPADEMNPVEAAAYHAPKQNIEGGHFEFGNRAQNIAYDNERPPWQTNLDAFAIATRPASNSEYLGFIQAGGYDKQAWWSRDGWHWLQRARVMAPDHWCRARNGAWYIVTASGPVALDGDATLYGISYFEAEAFSRYAGGRLPHELEWERSAASGACSPRGAWEWCGNAFFPYPQYHAYPYDGYSQPWFDGNHFTLRGASRYTLPPIRRHSFRNFYTPEKRHVFAGVRVAFDL
jgi:iron(II)-dependent oxidoreductase